MIIKCFGCRQCAKTHPEFWEILYDHHNCGGVSDLQWYIECCSEYLSVPVEAIKYQRLGRVLKFIGEHWECGTSSLKREAGGASSSS